MTDETLSRPVALDLYGRRLGFAWTFSGLAEGLDTEIRLDTIGGGHERVASQDGGGLTSARLGWPAFAAGRLYFSQECPGDGSGCNGRNGLRRYRYTTRELDRAPGPRAIISHERDGATTYLLVDTFSGTSCRGRPRRAGRDVRAADAAARLRLGLSPGGRRASGRYPTTGGEQLAIGALDQLGRPVAGLQRGEPDAHRPGSRVGSPIGPQRAETLPRLTDADAGKNAKELVPTDADEHVVRAHEATEILDHVAQQLVPHAVAVGVVDVLEPVHVDIGDDEILADSPRPVDLAPQLLQPDSTPASAGQLVDPGVLSIPAGLLAVARGELAVGRGLPAVARGTLTSEHRTLSVLIVALARTPHPRCVWVEEPVAVVARERKLVGEVSGVVTLGRQRVAFGGFSITVTRRVVPIASPLVSLARRL